MADDKCALENYRYGSILLNWWTSGVRSWYERSLLLHGAAMAVDSLHNSDLQDELCFLSEMALMLSIEESNAGLTEKAEEEWE